MSTAIYFIGLAMSFFHIYVLTIRAIDPWYFRSLQVVFAGVLLFALVPGWKMKRMHRIPIADIIFILMLVAPVVYLFVEFDEWIYRVGVVPTTWDFVFSLMFVVAVWEMARRASGWPLAVLAALFVLYGHFGNYMPGLFYHKGYDWDRMITYLSAMVGIVCLIVVSWIRSETRLGPKAILDILSKGARGSMAIASTCAAAGIIVSILTPAGLGTKFAMIIFNYSGGNLYIALVFTMIIAIAGFLIPSMFVLGPAMVLEGTAFEIVMVIITGTFGVIALAASMQNWLLTRCATWERIALAIAAVTLIKPGLTTDLIGGAIMAVIVLLQLARRKTAKAAA